MKPNTEPPRLVPIPIAVLLGAWFVFIVACFSDAGADFGPAAVLIYGSLLWAVVWLVRLIVNIVRQQRGTTVRPTLRYALVHWGLEPFVLILCGVLAFTGVLFYVRFGLSRPSLDAYVADIVAGRQQPHGYDSPKRWVGLFHVAETELQKDGVVRIITTSTFLDDAGFTYSPVSPPPHIGEDSYKHVAGAWYHWHRSW